MKINIGPYLKWWGPYQIVDLLFFWHNDRIESEHLHNRWDYKLHYSFAQWLSETRFQKLCQWIHDRRKRKVKIHIDDYDTWGMDYTLALIIVPMLKVLKEKKHGSPYIEDCDVPDNLGIRSTDVVRAKDSSGDKWDDNTHKRWDWVLSEIIWSFEQLIDDSAEDEFFIPSFKEEEYNRYHDRIQNGLRLFGVYYRGLWD